MDRYIDLDLFVNGGMDTLILCLCNRLLNHSPSIGKIAMGVLIGEVPIFLSAYWPESMALGISKVVVPLLMTGAVFAGRGMRFYAKATLLFWILSASLGGLIYGIWGWLYFEGHVQELRIGLKNLWVLPIAGTIWWISQKAWAGWVKGAAELKPLLCLLTIDFGKRGHPVLARALIDTGNQLRDPLTGCPVIILEEGIAAKGLPEELLPALNASWREMGDPWAWLWQEKPEWMQRLVFIPYQTVGHQSWMLGIRPQGIRCTYGQETRELKATVALVAHELSPDSSYQALMHPESREGVGGIDDRAI